MLETLPAWWPYAASAAYVILEYWLGRTDVVKGGSLVEVGLNTLKTVLGAMKKKTLPPKE